MRLSVDYYFEVVRERDSFELMAQELGHLSLTKPELNTRAANVKLFLERCEREIAELEQIPAIRCDLMDIYETSQAELEYIQELGLGPEEAARRALAVVGDRRTAIATEFACRQMLAESAPAAV